MKFDHNGRINDVQSSGQISSLFNEHPALILTVIYVAASTVGMVYSWGYLRHFGINVFNYAQIGDFLLASLKEPFTWLLVILAIILILIDNASSRRYQSKGSPKRLATLLGTTGQFLFLYDPAARRVDIHPNDNVQTISLCVPALEPAEQKSK